MRRVNHRRRHRLRLLAIDPTCRYCGRALTEENSTVDHVVPRRLCGPTATRNVVLACKVCNRWKGGMHPLEIFARVMKMIDAMK